MILAPVPWITRSHLVLTQTEYFTRALTKTQITTDGPFAGHGLSSLTLILSDSPPPEVGEAFEPVLDFAAFGSFSVILIIVAFLRSRITGIEEAIRTRTAALSALKDVKMRQLSGNATETDLTSAIDAYRIAYDRVESLRTVIPGIARLNPPPSSELTRERQLENSVAAQQYLGMTSPKEPKEEDRPGLPTGFLIVLLVVLTSQLALLSFLLDPNLILELAQSVP